MQLSPSTVPSDSTLLAGFVPAGVSAAASESVGLAEPAGFAELMAAIAPAPMGATPDVGQPLLRSTGATPATSGSKVVDVRTPGMAADIAMPAVEGLGEVEAPWVAEEGGEAPGGTVSSPHSRSAESAEEADAEESNLPRVCTPRRSLHEPVAGLETMIVPQMPMGPAPVADDELDLEEQPAELDTEEAPLDEDDSTGEETLPEIAQPAPHAGADARAASFPEIEPTADASRAALQDRYIGGRQSQAPTISSAASPMTRDFLSEGASRNVRRDAFANVDGADAPTVAATPGQGISITSASGETGDARAAAALPLATGRRSDPSAMSPAARASFGLPLEETLAEVPATTAATATVSPGSAETTAAAARPYGPAAQSLSSDVLARFAAASQTGPAAKPLAVEVRESTDAVSYLGEEDSSQVLGAASGFTAPVLPAPREGATRPATPRLVAAYGAREKFAVQREAVVGAHASSGSAQKNDFLNIDNEGVAYDAGGVGIDVAKSEAVMPTLSSSIAASPATPVAVGVHDVAATRAPQTTEARVTEAVSTAGQAVEVVLRAVDTVADREQKVVKLEFSVGDADLSVRVELAHDEVRTVFRTESPELRAALAHEWRAVASDSGEQGGVRLAPAVIADKEQAPSTSADADSQRQERHAARQEDASSSAHQAAARSLLRQAAPSHEATTAALPFFRPLAPLGTAQRLHLFA